MRWTPPMKAPCPPPTMPIRNLRFQDSIFLTPLIVDAEQRG
jgi:hypothetical protein